MSTEKYLWEIEYLDGTKVKEISDDGTRNNWTHYIKPPFIFKLIPNNNSLPPITLLIDKEEKRIIYFKRRVGQFNLGTGENKLVDTVYALGWQMTVEGKNVKNIIWVDTNTGMIYNCDDLNVRI